MLLHTSLGLVYDLLNAVAQSPDYWTILNTAFGSSYSYHLAATQQQQWQARDFSALPPIEIVGSEVLGNASGSYAAGDNTIYLANTFVAGATPEALIIEQAFSPVSNYSVGGRPTSLAVGDFNGDGKLDLAVTNFGSGSVSILLGNDAGGFSSASNYSIGSRPTALAVGDFNGDGKLDLATANIGSINISILSGDGTGSFSPASNYSVGSRPTSLAVGDFNGDGKLDLATTNLGDNSLSVLLGNDAGGFNTASNYSVGRNPTSVAVGDFNSDGKLDLATTNYSSDSTSILLGDGVGGFGTARNYSAGSDPYSVAVGDFNGDGKLDLATANLLSNSVSILQNSTPKITIDAGTTPTESGITGTYIISLDTIAPTGGLVVNFNTTGSTATPITDCTLSAGDNITNLTATSFTIAAGQTTATLNLTAASDAVNDPGETVQINLVGGGDYILGQNSTALLTPATNYSVGSDPYSVAVGDFNGDGKLDLATANRNSGNTSILLGNGAGGFDTASNYSVGGYPSSVAVGDLNSDGKLDLAIADGGLSTLLGDGSGGFGSPAYYNTSPEGKPRPAYAVAVGDFNGDGKLDFATANPYQYNNSVSILLGDGAGGVSTASYYYSVPDFPVSVAVGDFNGDGKLDLATANYASKCISVLLGNGVGGVSTSSYYSVPAYPVSVAVGDFNGDGKLDLATANLEDMGNQINTSVLLGNGAGGFGTAINSTGNSSWSVAVGDFNDDGKLDLTTANPSGDSASILLGNGAGDFSTAGDYSVGSSPYSVAVGDFNGDGKLDLTTANYSDDSTSVLLGADPSTTLTITDVETTPYLAGDNFNLSAVSENADALGLQQETLCLFTLDDFTVPNLRGANEDVFRFTPTAIAANGAISSGQYQTMTFFDGNFYGLGLNDVTGVDFGF